MNYGAPTPVVPGITPAVPVVITATAESPAPVVDYAGPSTPSRANPLARVPAEWWAVVLVAVSGLIGMVVKHNRDGNDEILLAPGVLAGGVWYVVARIWHRKRTRPFWKVQLLLATLLSLYAVLAVVGMAGDVDVVAWWKYDIAPGWRRVMLVGVGWFAVVEVAAWIDRRVTGYASHSACPPRVRPE